MIQGYQDRLFDLKCLTVYAGYWSGYYSNAKRPKPLNVVLKELLKGHMQSKKKTAPSTKVAKPAVDVEAFLAQEAQFNQRKNARR